MAKCLDCDKEATTGKRYCPECWAKKRKAGKPAEAKPEEKPAPVVPQKKWEMEVNQSSDGLGKYTVIVQITKDGDGVKVKISYLVDGKETTIETEDDGYATISFKVKPEEKKKVMIRLRGKQVNIEKALVLYGPEKKAKHDPAVGWWGNFVNNLLGK